MYIQVKLHETIENCLQTNGQQIQQFDNKKEVAAVCAASTCPCQVLWEGATAGALVAKCLLWVCQQLTMPHLLARPV